MPDRTYSQREVAALLARAAEGHRADGHDDGPGLTLAEVERAAAESGLDPALVRQAAADLDAGLLARRSDKTTVAERWVEAPFRLDAWEDAVAGLRVRYGESAPSGFGPAAPDVGRVGDSHEWTHRTAWGVQTTVTVSPRGGSTRVRVVTTADGSEDPRVHSAAISGVVAVAASLLAGGIVAETLSLGATLAVVAAVLLLVMAAGTPLLTRSTERQRARLAGGARSLADDLSRQLSRAAPSGPPEHESPEPDKVPGLTPEPRLDPSLLDADAAEPGATVPARRTRA